MFKKFTIFSLIFTGLLLSTAAMAQKNITLEDIWINGTFRPSGVSGLRSMADGEHYCTLTRDAIVRYSYLTGEKVDDVCRFQAPGIELPRFINYSFSNDEKKILLEADFEPIYRHSGVSTYYLYDMATRQFKLLTTSGKQRLTTLSPDGTKVAFVRDNNLYWMDLATLEEHAITTDGKLNKIIYGTTDWVYEEEFAITRGFQWSPDSKKIAYYCFDESNVKEYNMQMWGELYPEDYRYKYPKAGEDNSEVSLWVYDLDNSKTSRIATTDKTWEYIPRFQWTPSGTLTYMLMNRLQSHMQILTNTGTKLYAEQCDTYVEVPDTWQFITMGNGKKTKEQMLITSERDGFRHIYLYNMDGTMAKQVTSGGWEDCAVVGVDIKNQRLYYTSHEPVDDMMNLVTCAIEKNLFVIGFDGKKKKCLDHSFGQRLDVWGNPWHGDENAIAYMHGTYNATFSNGCKYYICTYSDANHPILYTLHDANGKLIKTLEDNQKLGYKMHSEYNVIRKMFGTFKTSNGTELNYYTFNPHDFDRNKKYPVLIYVYGGPGNQQVTNSYGYSDYYWYNMLAEKGYVVMCFDGRGTGGRGAAFKKQTYGDLGRMECEDAIEAARWLGQQTWVDKDRIGIWGWSFGGYLSTLALLKGNDVFKMAIAVAPVMNWRYYDNIYTERFLGLPKDNAKGYDENSPLNFADRLKGNYLLIHGTGDDNVHFQNSAEMVEKLEEAGKQFEFRIYPNKNHSIYDNTGNTRLNLYQLMTDFIIRKL